MAELAEEFSASVLWVDPEQLADHLALLLEGVYASTQPLGHRGPARHARALAATLLSDTRPERSSAGSATPYR